MTVIVKNQFQIHVDVNQILSVSLNKSIVGYQENQEQKVTLVAQVKMETTESQDHKDQAEPQEFQDQQDHQEPTVPQVSQELTEVKDHKDQLDPQEYHLLEKPEMKDQQDPQDHKDQLEVSVAQD